MQEDALARWRHDHSFGQDRRRPGERRTQLVIVITATMMVVEIAAGVLFGSMALLADGLHMASHAVALGINAYAYAYARRHAHDASYSFGTGKVNTLGGFTGAVLLAAFALLMAVGKRAAARRAGADRVRSGDSRRRPRARRQRRVDADPRPPAWARRMTRTSITTTMTTTTTTTMITTTTTTTITSARRGRARPQSRLGLSARARRRADLGARDRRVAGREVFRAHLDGPVHGPRRRRARRALVFRAAQGDERRAARSQRGARGLRGRRGGASSASTATASSTCTSGASA